MSARTALGALAGLIGGLILTVLYLVIYLATGGIETAAGAAVSPGMASTLYVGGGVLGGAIVAAAFPLTRWRVGAMLLGVVAVTPLFVPSAYVYFGGFTYEAVTGAIVIATMVGVVIGFMLHQDREAWQELGTKLRDRRPGGS